MSAAAFVQLIHPGGEHEPDHSIMKQWNRNDHARKFLTSPGRYRTLPDAAEQEGEIVFWGEWEPESRVVARYASLIPDGPQYLYEPFYLRHVGRSWRQNTDPAIAPASASAASKPVSSTMMRPELSGQPFNG